MYWIPVIAVVLTVRFIFFYVLDEIKASDCAKTDRRREQVNQFMSQYCDVKLELELKKWLEEEWKREIDTVCEFLNYADGADKLMIDVRYEAALMILLAQRGKVYSGMCKYGAHIISKNNNMYYDPLALGIRYFQKLEQVLRNNGVAANIFGYSYGNGVYSVYDQNAQFNYETGFYFAQSSVYQGEDFFKKYGRQTY